MGGCALASFKGSQRSPSAKGVCSFADYYVVYEEIQSNRVSDLRDLVCSLFQRHFFFLLLFHSGK